MSTKNHNSFPFKGISAFSDDMENPSIFKPTRKISQIQVFST